MSQRPRIPAYPVIIDGDMSTNLTSIVTIIQSLTMISYQLDWTGTSPVGNVSVEVSNNYSIDGQGNTLNAGTWDALPLEVSGALVTQIPISGNTGQGFIDITLNAAYAIRLIYAKTSGVGTLNVIENAKVA